MIYWHQLKTFASMHGRMERIQHYMEIEKFTAPLDNQKVETLTKVSLTDDEWLVFLRNISNIEVKNVDTNNVISDRDLEYIDTNRCVPLCANNNFVTRYGADTRMLSIISVNYGEIPLRLWFAEHGVLISLNKVMEEAFPGGFPEEVLRDFWEWWGKMPLESQAVGGRLITKNRREFGIGHLAAWIQQHIGSKEAPKVAWQNYLYNLKPFMYAYEFFVICLSRGLIKNDNGFLSPINA